MMQPEPKFIIKNSNNVKPFLSFSLGDILVYINDSCVLGTSYKEVVEMLKAVPVGQSVDMVVRRGYPILYDPNGSPRLFRDHATKSPSLPTTTQPKAHSFRPQAEIHRNELVYRAETRHPGALRGRASRFSLDANGNASHFPPPPRTPSSYPYSSEAESDFQRPYYTPRGVRGLQSADLASQSDSEVVSAIGSHR